MELCPNHYSQYSNVGSGGAGTQHLTRSNYLMTPVVLLANVGYGRDSDLKHTQALAGEVTAGMLPVQKIMQAGLLGTNLPD